MSEIDQQAAPGTIVLVHGLWMTPHSWEPWAQRFSNRGYEVLTPAWPGLEGHAPAEIRRDPSALAGLGVTEITDHYDRVIRGLDRAPIVIGHSFGGLITQLLLDRGLGAAGVAIAPAPPKGVLKLPWSSIRTAWPALKNPANRKRAFTLSPEQFRYRFGNTMSEQESNAVYEREYIPGSGRMLFQAAFANVAPNAATKLDPRKLDRSPMLLIAGEKDHVSPAAAVRSNYKRYRHSPAVTEYREFPGRSHSLCGERGWEEIADLALEWSTEKAART
jgi:pimeloyl-ACP methyl ester carboxylesterase